MKYALFPMDVDIVLPYYNGSGFIQDQLESIKNCLIPDDVTFRVLVIDDCSKPAEIEFLNSLIPSYPFLEIHSNPHNLGVVGSVERGLALTTAPFIMLCDQDDYWLPDKILVTLKKLQTFGSSSSALVFTDLKIVDEKLNLKHPSMFECFNYHPERIRNGILMQNMVTGCTVGMNRRLVEVALPFPKNLLIHDHWLAICATYTGEIEGIKTPTILYRQHGSNLIGAHNESIWQKLLRFPQKVRAKHHSHLLKSEQTLALVQRLKERNISTHIHSLELIADSLKANQIDDVLYLLKQRVINLRPSRKLAIICFFIAVAVFKKLRPSQI